MLTPIKFGTDGWRAVVGEIFTPENVERLAQAFTVHMRQKCGKDAKIRIVVGFDSRNKSRESAKTFTQILAANGFEVVLSDKPVPTPAVSRYVIEGKFNAGIVITASHNPARYNGVKIKDSQGSSADLSVTRSVEACVDKEPVKKDNNFDIASVQKDILSGYLTKVREYVNFDLFNNHDFNVLTDSMHGTGSNILETLLKDTSVNLTTIRGDEDITFGGSAPEPILKNLSQTKKMMSNGTYEIGFATDGDSDRIGAVRPGGSFVSPGTLLALILLHLAKDLKKEGSVVTTISNTSLIYRVARKLGLKIHETPVGFKYICEIMRKENVLIAGEESGGLAFQNYMLERDGILSALLILQMMQFRKQGFEEILTSVEKEFGKFYYDRRDLIYQEELKPKLLEHLKKLDIKDIEGSRVVEKKTYDGIKLLIENDAWLLFRVSGTEPLLRVYAESTNELEAKKLTAWGERLARSLET